MGFVWRCLLLLPLGGSLLLSAVQAEPVSALALQQRVIQIFEQNKDAVVQVKAAYAKPGVTEEGKKEVMLRVGTGFFISREGHVLVSASRAAGPTGSGLSTAAGPMRPKRWGTTG